jgi:hypothetical protein
LQAPVAVSSRAFSLVRSITFTEGVLHFFEVSLLCEDQLFFAPWPMYCSVLAFFFTSSRLQVVSTSFAPVVLMVKGVKFLLPTHHESQPLG